MSERINRTQLFMEMAHLISRRSTCLRGNVGCVIVQDKRVVSMGYNGAPPGLPHCLDVGCEEGTISVASEAPPEVQKLARYVVKEGCQRTVHAEANAIAFSARSGIPTASATMYCTHAPCRKCAELLISAGIAELHFEKPYRVDALDILDNGGVVVYRYDADPHEQAAG